MSEPIIKVENLGKQYHIGANSADTLRDQITAMISRLKGRGKYERSRSDDTIWALKDISFTVQPGEVVGIIGHNGAGKSTLLKILSRITHPTTGRMEIDGRVSSLLEVGTGFHPELTGRENIFMNAAILGMKRSETLSKFDEIVAFAEVEKFIDTPVKRYSSGMYMRLAFAVAAHLEPEILIVDEVLSVGDAAFQKKSLGKMSDVAQQGRTVLFVSHNLLAVRSLCPRSIWLDNGQIRMEGLTDAVVNTYQGLDAEYPITQLSFPDEAERPIQITKVELKDGKTYSDDEPLQLEITYVVRQSLPDVLLAVEVRTAADAVLYYANDDGLEIATKREVGSHRTMLKIPANIFAPGDYSIAFGFWQPGHPPVHFPSERLTFRRKAKIDRLSQFGTRWPSLLYVPSEWQYIQGEVLE